MTDRPTHRERAAEVVREVADRLADPEDVAGTAQAPDNLLRYPGNPQPVWNPLLLSDGYPGVALLFAELAAQEPEMRGRAHAYLTAGLASGIALLPQSLYGGMVALAFAGHTAATGFGGYGTMLAGLDAHITGHARGRAREDRERALAGRPVGAWTRYDVLDGTAGVGRYLLARYEHGGEEARATVEPALRDVLESLVATATADDVEWEGVRRPVWWITEGLEYGLDEHVNLGLAHGVCGPLALLSLAWRAGVRVDRQDEAIERMMGLLTRWRVTDGTGPRWPHLMNREHLASGQPHGRGRDSWCYGAAGTARAVYLAGAALDRADWREEAHTALHGALSAATEKGTVDSALCHGWAGLLHLAQRTEQDSGDPAYRPLVDDLAGRVVEGFDPEAPFGYRYHHHLAPRDLDRPGFLEGAAGIALALHSYATGQPPATSWDGALLIR
ncbi:lanthionine synthetase C family protein [Streptomyces sp. NPDC005438]|uniref:lanthionine synthetase C family protein n=1 Tax=Streptomyces sp. NPDC005438 TaxID=3156880 RepID=UPI0033A2D9B3